MNQLIIFLSLSTGSTDHFPSLSVGSTDHLSSLYIGSTDYLTPLLGSTGHYTTPLSCINRTFSCTNSSFSPSLSVRLTSNLISFYALLQQIICTVSCLPQICFFIKKKKKTLLFDCTHITELSLKKYFEYIRSCLILDKLSVYIFLR